MTGFFFTLPTNNAAKANGRSRTIITSIRFLFTTVNNVQIQRGLKKAGNINTVLTIRQIEDFPVRPGRIIFEIDGIKEEVAKGTFRNRSHLVEQALKDFRNRVEKGTLKKFV